MTVKINFRCIGCGICEHIAPNSFRLDDAGGISVALSQIVTDATKKAEELCPVNAIKIDLPEQSIE